MTTESRLRPFALFTVVSTLVLFAWCLPDCVAQAPAKLLVSNAYIFSMAPDQLAPFHGYLVVGDDGTLLAVAAGDPPASLKAATVVWNAEGHWVVPGFISAHSHLWQSAYRGLALTRRCWDGSPYSMATQ